MRPSKAESRDIDIQQAIFLIKIVLRDTKPPIWRRVLVPAQFTLEELHNVVQAAMGWEDCHLHQFYIDKQSFGIPDPSEALAHSSTMVDEKKACLANVLNRVGQEATYIYDFGDSWEHAMTVEKILGAEPNVAYPLCINGKLASPPEDCGGVSSFYDMLDVLADPNHEDHEDVRDWIEHFDPEAFSAEAVNKRLRKTFRVNPNSARQLETRLSDVLLRCQPVSAWYI